MSARGLLTLDSCPTGAARIPGERLGDGLIYLDDEFWGDIETRPKLKIARDGTTVVLHPVAPMAFLGYGEDALKISECPTVLAKCADLVTLHGASVALALRGCDVMNLLLLRRGGLQAGLTCLLLGNQVRGYRSMAVWVGTPEAFSVVAELPESVQSSLTSRTRLQSHGAT
jgi:hypothetical protein